MKAVTIFTDGCCLGNPGPGGYATILRHGNREKILTGNDPKTTNQRMELLAAIAGLSALKKPCSVEVVSDSQYLVKGMTEWIQGWQAKGWKNSGRKPVENRDLWEKLLALTERHQVKWIWIRGHNGHPENERCDRLAKEATTRPLLARRAER